MSSHNINFNKKSDMFNCCRVAETTDEHDCCVAEMIKSSSIGLNKLSAVFDKSTNTLTRKSYGHLAPHERIQKAREFQNILMTHADNSTKHVLVKSEVIKNNTLKLTSFYKRNSLL